MSDGWGSFLLGQTSMERHVRTAVENAKEAVASSHAWKKAALEARAQAEFEHKRFVNERMSRRGWQTLAMARGMMLLDRGSTEEELSTELKAKRAEVEATIIDPQIAVYDKKLDEEMGLT